MPRQARLDYPGALHHVIARGIDGAYVFKEDKDKKEFLSRLKQRLSESSLQLYAWALMSNHVHLLIQTGETPLAEFMRSVLTGYAIYYNKIHKRKGYLFQNRYKSILCESDEYLLPLIRYIHLNPVKAGIVTFQKLEQFLWTGHKELMEGGRGPVAREEVLGFFGEKEDEAKKVYVDFLREGLNVEEDLMGGGLIRSSGGMENTLKAGYAKKNDRQNYDERILGTGNFVDDVLERLESGEKEKKFFHGMDDLLGRLSGYYRVEKNDIVNNRTKGVREARNVLVYLGNVYLGESMTAMGRLLRIKQSAASQARGKGQKVAAEKLLVKELIKFKF